MSDKKINNDNVFYDEDADQEFKDLENIVVTMFDHSEINSPDERRITSTINKMKPFVKKKKRYRFYLRFAAIAACIAIIIPLALNFTSQEQFNTGGQVFGKVPLYKGLESYFHEEKNDIITYAYRINGDKDEVINNYYMEILPKLGWKSKYGTPSREDSAPKVNSAFEVHWYTTYWEKQGWDKELAISITTIDQKTLVLFGKAPKDYMENRKKYKNPN
ncbi:hypothetical protein [Virgibacillus sp. JSM 102003]|uniref:hypothetical protein n=1 Tax=Virgibacillus sp. JSM 102003 TaxID=1562108 RepID=UPI0035C148CC